MTTVRTEHGTAMRVTVVAFLLVSFVACELHAERRRAIRKPSGWDAALTVSPVMKSVNGTERASSSKLAVAWTARSGVDHYTILAADVAGPALSWNVEGSKTGHVIDALESATEYEISIVACMDPECELTLAGTGTSARASTAEEIWQVHGTGASYQTATRIVSDGNTKPYGLTWGAGAGASLEGAAQLYYDPMFAEEKGIKLATLPGPLTSSPDSIATFLPLSGFGFLRERVGTQEGFGPSTFQPVPLSAEAGGRVRMFWEATSADGRGRVWSLDSQDGWLGRDFHPGAETICRQSDMLQGAPCSAALLIGTAQDDAARWPEIREARQLKVGFPILDDWRWSASAGTFMIVTLHFTGTRCSPLFFNAGSAIWDGTRWNVEYGPDGCPKLIQGVQAPMPIHIGAARYKMYFNENRSANGGPAGQTKPLKLLYADGRATGDPARVSFDDWEPAERAREIRVLWPDGSLMSELDESQFDDYCVWMPTGSPDYQVMLSNMSCAGGICGPPFIGMAVLLNP